MTKDLLTVKTELWLYYEKIKDKFFFHNETLKSEFKLISYFKK